MAQHAPPCMNTCIMILSFMFKHIEHVYMLNMKLQPLTYLRLAQNLEAGETASATLSKFKNLPTSTSKGH